MPLAETGLRFKWVVVADARVVQSLPRAGRRSTDAPPSLSPKVGEHPQLPDESSPALLLQDEPFQVSVVCHPSLFLR